MMSITEDSYTPDTQGVRKNFTKEVVCELTLERGIGRTGGGVRRQFRQKKIVHANAQRGNESGVSGEWYGAQPSLIKLSVRERPQGVEQNGTWLSRAEVKGFLCVAGFPRSCDLIISFHIKFILIMAHYIICFSKAQGLRGQI